jgi:hypothetical protein
MKKIKKPIALITSLLLMAVLILPSATFAKDNGKGENEHANNTSVFARLSAFFGAKANANANINISGNVNAPTITGITAPTTLKVGETGTWVVKASDPQNGALSYSVNWGDNDRGPMAMLSQPAFVQTSTFTHAYAKAGNYFVRFMVQNSAGLKAFSGTTVRVGDVSVNPPVITNVLTTGITANSGTISWTTDIASDSRVFYSTVTPVDAHANTTESVIASAKVTSHSVGIYGLTPNTTYHYIVKSKGDKASITVSAEGTFTTSS